jgi:hypothetical protein
VYKLQDPESRLKYKSFLLEVADYWAGMTVEETHEEDDIHVEATDEGDDPPTWTEKKSCWEAISRHGGVPTSGNCWAGMASEETHEEDDVHVEAADEDDDPPTCTKKKSCWEAISRHGGAPT